MADRRVSFTLASFEGQLQEEAGRFWIVVTITSGGSQWTCRTLLDATNPGDAEQEGIQKLARLRSTLS